MTNRGHQLLLRALLREDFAAFVEKVFETVAPGDRFRPNWHIDAVAHALSMCLSGETTRLIITQPPRSLKSICASVAFPAWALGHDPTLRLICVSYSQDLALELARQFRLVTSAEWYRVLFPQMRLQKDTGAECVTNMGGARLATSIGGTLTGRGADIIVIDDPLKAEEAASETARRQVIQWYQATLTTRLDDKDAGVIILVMQRLHQDDLAGHVLRNGGWAHLDLPAIAVEDQTIALGQHRLHRRKAGEILHAGREPAATLERLRSELGSLRFSAQYQQRPVPAEGNLIRREWLRTYAAHPSGVRVQRVQSWDIATTSTDTGDFSACVTAAIHKDRFYILDVWRGRLAYPDLKRKIVAHAQLHRPETVLIERAGLGLPLVQDFQFGHHEGMPHPIGVLPEGDKVVRLEAVSPLVERGDLLLPEDASWLGELLEELLGFPNSRHDDQVDALSQLLNWHRNHQWYEPLIICGPIIVRGD